MQHHIDPNAVCEKSDGVIAREIEDETIIVPLVAGIGDADDELYTLSETGRAVWRAIDGRRSLREVAALLADEFDAPLEAIERDVIGFADELLRRGILVTRP